MKLGKKPPKMDGRRLFLSRYLSVGLPPAPDSQNWIGAITDWGMMKNDALGCCTIAGVGHAIQTWTANTQGVPADVTDDQIVNYYEKWDGYNPDDSSTDQGGVEVDVLNQWRKDSFSGHELLGYVDVDPANIEHYKLAILMFGGVYIGLALPVEWQGAAVWDKVGTAGSWGLHCVWCPAYNPTGPICITWGEPKQITWAAAGDPEFCDEVHALLSKDFITAKGSTAYGLDLAAAQNDLVALDA